MDLATLFFLIAFEGALIVVAGLLVVTFVAFRRMNNDVRRARMFIMADRVVHFLGAFTVGFVVIAVDLVLSDLSLPGAVILNLAAVIVFIGAILYGSVQLFLVVRPRRKGAATARLRGRRSKADAASAPSRGESPEGETHASR